MKIIFSRKGFDSQYGGCPSPILPSGELISLPIPGQDESATFQDVTTSTGSPLAALLQELKCTKVKANDPCHLDPDIYPWSLPRKRGWRPCFGQRGAAQSHLSNHEVGLGDVFLFFGFFRSTEFVEGKLSFKRGSQLDKHVLFSWLQVGQVLKVGEQTKVPKWLSQHPHCSPKHRKDPNNAIYIASHQLSLDPSLPGSGSFRATSSSMLTKEGKSRSKWNLDPNIFKNKKITYHSTNSWKDDYFQSAAKGQEFIVTADESISKWLLKLILSSRSHV